MPQPYQFEVIEGGLSPPKVVCADAAGTAAVADNEYTFTESVMIEFIVEDAEIEVQFYDGTNWTTDDGGSDALIPMKKGVFERRVKAEGVRFKNRSGTAATVSIARYES